MPVKKQLPTSRPARKAKKKRLSPKTVVPVALEPEVVPSQQPETTFKKPWTIWQILFISFGLSLLITLGLLLLTAVAVAGLAYSQVKQFADTAGVTTQQLKETVVAGLEHTPVQTEGRKNILLLGTDELETRGAAPVLTDTILFASLDFNSGSITTLALPRDIWLDEYQSKINALYYYGKAQNPEHPEVFVSDSLSAWTGVPIHHTFVLSFKTVSELIDILEGVDVTIPEGFTDELFPRTDIDVTIEKDPAKLYKTVTFTPGIEKMSGERALEYMRSRHSGGTTGTDTSRSQRQAAVIMAVLQKVRSPEVILNPTQAGKLYKFYLDHFSATYSPTELVATLKALLPHRSSLKIQAQQLSIYPGDPDGIIYHPVQNERTNWIYRVRIPAQFQSSVQELLYVSTATPPAALSATDSGKRRPAESTQ